MLLVYDGQKYLTQTPLVFCAHNDFLPGVQLTRDGKMAPL